MNSINVDLRQVLTVFLFLIGVGVVICLILVGFLIVTFRRIQLPPDADLITALRATPLVVVITLDMLDFTLDFLSAPFSWALLTRLGLKPLRAVTVIESLIPGTQFIPTMTAAWIIARLVKRSDSLDRILRNL
jgi:hypothetical protein